MQPWGSTINDNAAADAAALAAEAGARSGVFRQLGTLRRALFASSVGRSLKFLMSSLLLVIIGTSFGQIVLNRWNKPFYDALSRRDLREFLVQLGVFFMIAAVLLVLNVFQRWVVESLKIKLREGVVRDLVGHWMLPRRAFWLSTAGPMGVNPDQRMTEDAQKMCDLSTDLGAGLLQASILFISFSGILWGISADFSIRIGGIDYAVPGFMVWAAILYAGTGSLLSYWVGRSLIARNADRYSREGELRFALVRINEHLDGISLAAGEADEKRRVERHLGDVMAAMRRLVRGWTNLTWVTAGFGWTTLVAPILIAAPLYLTGKISFGGMMMAAAAFTQAQQALRWFVDNFGTIAEWRATLLRVAGFREALTANAEIVRYASRISYTDGASGSMSIIGLEVESAPGRDRLDEANVVVKAGERVLILGSAGTGKTLLFRALAGLWPWGAGEITRPADEAILYMPRGTPYLPSGTLREVLAYPMASDRFAQDRCEHALKRLGLERLVPLLDAELRWDRELSHEDQMCLAFSRVLLQSPSWLVMDEALSMLEDESLERVIDVLTNELSTTGIIHIGKAAEAGGHLFSQVLHLVKATPELPRPVPGSDQP